MAITLESLKKTVGKKKGNSRVFAWLADMERASGDLDGSLSRVNVGLQAFSADLPGMLVRSRILFERGEFEECIVECEKALKNDPLCLSAQKRMGDAYDQLGNEVERNKCYRRVHDMDPLDNFWKEEYETVLVEAAAVVDSDFVMPGLGESGEESSEGESSEGGLSFLSSASDDDDSISFIKAESIDDEDEPAVEESSSIFEKSSDSSSKSGSSIFSHSFDDSEESPLSKFAIDENNPSIEDDVVMETISPKEPEVPSASESFSSSAALFKSVDDALQFSGIDTSDDSVGIEEPAGASESNATAETEDDPFAALSALLPNDDDADTSAMDSLQESLDAAMAGFDSSDDDVQEEFPTDENISGGDVSNIFANMFGDDTMEEDESAEESSPFNNLNIPSEVASDSFAAKDVGDDNLSLTNDENLFGLMEKIEPSKDQDAAVQAAPAPSALDDQPQSVDSAFASIFGEDELPEENESFTAKPTAFAPEPPPKPEPQLETLPEQEPSGLSDLEASMPGLQSAIEPSPELEPLNLSSPAEPEIPVVSKPVAEDGPQSLDSAFASIFGDDELPEENATASPSSPPADTTLSFDGQAVGSLNAIFGDDDDLPVEKPPSEDFSAIFDESPATSTVEPETSEDVPVIQESLSEQVTKAEDELQLPPSASGLESELGGAFNSIFGEDDLPDESSGGGSSAPSEDNLFEPSGSPLTQESTSAAAEESVIPSMTDPSLENEVDGAFKGLFFTDDDDSLPGTEGADNSSGKGVDFLMSGDSDDEVSVGLIKDPSQPLNRNNADIDESLNTRTLAEIYFEQGLYAKALDIYQDLCSKEPKNSEYRERLEQIEKIYRNKFGGNING